MKINEFLQKSPVLEVAVRHAYWRMPWLVERRARQPPVKLKKAEVNTFGEILEALQSMGVTPGRLAVVHSGYNALKPAGASPQEIVAGLVDLLGPEGTLAVPAIPHYKDAPSGPAYMTADVSQLVLEYDPRTTPCFTGAIPDVVMKTAGAVRSQHPLNSMAALGPLAAAMVARDLEGEAPMPCGPTSSWKFCIDHDAVVVGLGVDMAHALTMIHAAEDCRSELWPQPNWYRVRRFMLVEGDGKREIVVRERQPHWAKYYAERTLQRDLLRDGVMTERTVRGMVLYVLGARQLYDYLNSRNSRGYPYYLLPATLPVLGRLTGGR